MILLPERSLLSLQKPALWNRRKLELVQWTERPKLKLAPKKTAFFQGCMIDAELHGTLCLLNRKHVVTEFSCAGVSIWDEPEDHSLYAYITMKADERSGAFVQWAMRICGIVCLSFTSLSATVMICRLFFWDITVPFAN
ncbi:hypothetical protein ABEW24_23550 [Paenibacillus jamilae]|uniref:hypothetical protein n=1 Tax=Paenibacillus jamilae TaxID=114136 RepID=UPI003D26D864